MSTNKTILFFGTKLYLTDIPLCQNMVQSHFIVGATPESKLIRGRCKRFLTFSVLSFWEGAHIKHKAINAVLHADKDLGGPPTEVKFRMQTEPPGTNARIISLLTSSTSSNLTVVMSLRNKKKLHRTTTTANG